MSETISVHKFVNEKWDAHRGRDEERCFSTFNLHFTNGIPTGFHSRILLFAAPGRFLKQEPLKVYKIQAHDKAEREDHANDADDPDGATGNSRVVSTIQTLRVGKRILGLDLQLAHQVTDALLQHRAAQVDRGDHFTPAGALLGVRGRAVRW